MTRYNIHFYFRAGDNRPARVIRVQAQTKMEAIVIALAELASNMRESITNIDIIQ